MKLEVNQLKIVITYKFRKQQAERVVHKAKDPITKQEKHNCQEIHSCFEKYYKNGRTAKDNL